MDCLTDLARPAATGRLGVLPAGVGPHDVVAVPGEPDRGLPDDGDGA
ncbi:hypothetical protein [Streptomyces sp. NPDC090022]